MKRPNYYRIGLLGFLAFLQGTFPLLQPQSPITDGWTRRRLPKASLQPFERKRDYPHKLLQPFTYGSLNSHPDSNEIQNEDGDISFPELTPRCRIVTRSSSCIPTDPSILPRNISQSPYLLDKLDNYYHAKARKIEQDLGPLQAHEREMIEGSTKPIRGRTIVEEQRGDDTVDQAKPKIPALRQSLEDSGFELLSQRDIDLCECLNAGYLLRLSLVPDVSELDPIISREFYPELFHTNGTLKAGCEDVLFDGRVLVYWRGYSQEVTKGRLLLPKINYLQANVVKRAAAWVKNQLDRFESSLFRAVRLKSLQLRHSFQKKLFEISKKLQIPQFKRWIEGMFADEFMPDSQVSMATTGEFTELESGSNTGKKVMNRYGGSKTLSVEPPDPLDELSPFILCEIDYNDQSAMNSSTGLNSSMYYGSMNSSTGLNSSMYYGSMNSSMSLNSTMYSGAATNSSTSQNGTMSDRVNRNNAVTCAYDGTAQKDGKQLPRMQLLERVSIGSLIDVFNKVGRRGLLKTIFSKSELVEPTYEEIVVVWRPLVKSRRKIAPPKVVSEFADMFDVEGFEQPEEDKSGPQSGNLEVRLFEQVPMSNLPAVLPKTKLVFRPADALLFDTISVFTFLVVLGSIKFDSTRLDLLALVSVTLWVLRTVFRYSNKLARYDLLVKTFLTTKISQRNSGAFNYLTYEAGSQRAIRTALVHQWILQQDNAKRSKLTKSILEQNCEAQINRLLNTENEVQIDVKRAFEDLEELNLLSFSKSDGRLLRVKDMDSSSDAVKELWMDLFENERKFNDPSRSASKSRTVVTEPDMDILDMLEEIDAAAANVQKLRDGDWRGGRKKLANAIGEKKDAGIAKAMAALEERRGENIAKAKALLEGKKDESIAKAKAALDEKKEESIQKAKTVLEEGRVAGIEKARKFLVEKKRSNKQD
eukprot:jgi/Psemu1/14754/gm1.14754_g